jgi:Xaa-Pro aminopeptidase
MDLQAIQAELTASKIDGWLFYDFHNRDPIAYSVLGLDGTGMASRRWFYLIPASGEPIKLAHQVEPHKIDALPGRKILYRSWRELKSSLEEMLGGHKQIAMQYSPMGNIPYVAMVDAGTIELVRSCGPEVVSSAGLVQRFEAVSGEEGLASHRDAGVLVQTIRQQAYEKMDKALRDGTAVTESEVRDFILARFKEEGMTSDGDSPIVGFNDHPADPHFEPKPEHDYTLKKGDTILIDLWARFERLGAIYYDVTWCGFAGGEPPEEYVRIWDTVCTARDAALALVQKRFGKEPLHGWEIDEASRAVVEKAGYGDAFVHRTGHSIGTEVHGNGANIDNLETRDDRELVPGLCFSIEPGIYLEGRFGVRTEIDVVLTPQGKVEVFGPIQKDLIRIGA